MDGLRFGRQFRPLRVRARRRQIDVAARAGLSRSLISAIDRGELSGVTVGAVTRAAAALGADVDLRLRFRGEHLDRLLDEDHARIVDVVVHRLKHYGWTVEVEASFSIWGERGSVDVLAFRASSGSLLVVEVKSAVSDSQDTLHRLDRKTRLASQLAEGRGWWVRTVSRLLVIGDSDTSRRRITRLAATYDAALPDRGGTVRRWLRTPENAISGLLFVAYDSHGNPNRGLGGRERVRRPRSASKGSQPSG